MRRKADDLFRDEDGCLITPANAYQWNAAVTVFHYSEENMPSRRDALERRARPLTDQMRFAATERDAVDAIQESFRIFGPDAVWKSWARRERGRYLQTRDGHTVDLTTMPDAALDDLRSLVRSRIRALWERARWDVDRDVRLEAARLLRDVLTALVPEQRGKRPAIGANDEKQMRTYYDELLRWSLIRPALKEFFSKRLTLKSIALLAAIYDEPEDSVRRYLRLDVDGELLHRDGLEKPEALALRHAALRLRMTAATLEKRLSMSRARMRDSAD